MSRAFVRESDHSDNDPPPVQLQLPPGVNNLITPAGAQRFQAELASSLEEKRQLLLSQDGLISAEREARKRKLESHIRRLQETLQSVVITHPPSSNPDRVCFGAHILVRHADGQQTTYHIVGIHETDPDRGHISWRSPLARALLSRRVSDRVRFNSPSGLEEFEIISVAYGE